MVRLTVAPPWCGSRRAVLREPQQALHALDTLTQADELLEHDGRLLRGLGARRQLGELPRDPTQLGPYLKAHPNELVLVGGHTDDVPISTERFRSNWELSAARATAVARVLVEEGAQAGLDASRVVASGFGEHHPRSRGQTEAARQNNRRIEVQLVPIRVVSSR